MIDAQANRRRRHDAPRSRSTTTNAISPVEHVRTHCPALIATLVAMARMAKDDRGVDNDDVRLAGGRADVPL